jgi:hypothetical protein
MVRKSAASIENQLLRANKSKGLKGHSHKYFVSIIPLTQKV